MRCGDRERWHAITNNFFISPWEPCPLAKCVGQIIRWTVSQGWAASVTAHAAQSRCHLILPPYPSHIKKIATSDFTFAMVDSPFPLIKTPIQTSVQYWIWPRYWSAGSLHRSRYKVGMLIPSQYCKHPQKPWCSSGFAHILDHRRGMFNNI
jgi:hypothetical protein